MGYSFVARRRGCACTEDAAHRLRTRPPSLQHLDRRYTKCSQHSDCIDRWSCLRMDSRHALPTAGIPRTNVHPAIQNRRYRTYYHVLPAIRPNLLHRRYGRRRNLSMPPLRPSRRKGRYGPSSSVPRPHSTHHVDSIPPSPGSS